MNYEGNSSEYRPNRPYEKAQIPLEHLVIRQSVFRPHESQYTPEERPRMPEMRFVSLNSFGDIEKTSKIVTNTAISSATTMTGLALGVAGAHFLMRGGVGVFTGLSTFSATQGLPGLLGTIVGTAISPASLHLVGGLLLLYFSGLALKFGLRKLTNRAYNT